MARVVREEQASLIVLTPVILHLVLQFIQDLPQFFLVFVISDPNLRVRDVEEVSHTLLDTLHKLCSFALIILGEIWIVEIFA